MAEEQTGPRWWRDGRLQPITTDEQLKGWCDEHSVPYRERGGRVMVLDMSLLPAGLRTLLDDRGSLRPEVIV